jgi:hypothetical protein
MEGWTDMERKNNLSIWLVEILQAASWKSYLGEIPPVQYAVAPISMYY